MPDDCNESIVCPIYKKGNSKEYKNYRGISILNSTYKVLSKILGERLKTSVDTNVVSCPTDLPPIKYSH